MVEKNLKSNEQKEETSEKNDPKLYKCIPVDWLWLPQSIRLLLAWIFDFGCKM